MLITRNWHLPRLAYNSNYPQCGNSKRGHLPLLAEPWLMLEWHKKSIWESFKFPPQKEMDVRNVRSQGNGNKLVAIYPSDSSLPSCDLTQQSIASAIPCMTPVQKCWCLLNCCSRVRSDQVLLRSGTLSLMGIIYSGRRTELFNSTMNMHIHRQ